MSREVCYHSRYRISAKTIKEIVCVCRGIFTRLMEDAGLIVSPWSEVILPEEESTPRRIYTQEEIARIAEGISEDPQRMRNVYQGQSDQFDHWCQYARFCRPLFLIGASGWPEVDICTMTCDNVDRKAQAIIRNRSKTGAYGSVFYPRYRKTASVSAANRSICLPGTCGNVSAPFRLCFVPFTTIWMIYGKPHSVFLLFCRPPLPTRTQQSGGTDWLIWHIHCHRKRLIIFFLLPFLPNQANFSLF